MGTWAHRRPVPHIIPWPATTLPHTTTGSACAPTRPSTPRGPPTATQAPAAAPPPQPPPRRRHPLLPHHLLHLLHHPHHRRRRRPPPSRVPTRAAPRRRTRRAPAADTPPAPQAAPPHPLCRRCAPPAGRRRRERVRDTQESGSVLVSTQRKALSSHEANMPPHTFGATPPARPPVHLQQRRQHSAGQQAVAHALPQRARRLGPSPWPRPRPRCRCGCGQVGQESQLVAGLALRPFQQGEGKGQGRIGMTGRLKVSPGTGNEIAFTFG